jgi:adenosylcobinamide amidohydrolase
MRVELHWREEDGVRLPMACWRPGPGYRMIASSVLGGGIGPRNWVLNAQVRGGYDRMDPAAHLIGLAAGLRLDGPGVGMLTAAQVTDLVQRADEDVTAIATTGLRVPTWAAAPADAADPELKPVHVPRTINIVVEVPVPLTDAALVNAVVTVTEAKTQAVLEAGFAGTGTASDAVCVACRDNSKMRAEEFAGPRSSWGARIGRAVYAAVLDGATAYKATLLAADGPSAGRFTQPQLHPAGNRIELERDGAVHRGLGSGEVHAAAHPAVPRIAHRQGNAAKTLVSFDKMLAFAHHSWLAGSQSQRDAVYSLGGHPPVRAVLKAQLVDFPDHPRIPVPPQHDRVRVGNGHQHSGAPGQPG